MAKKEETKKAVLKSFQMIINGKKVIVKAENIEEATKLFIKKS